MKIRELNARLGGDEARYDFKGGVEIVADDGRALFYIYELKDGGIEVSASGTCKHGTKVFDGQLILKPQASNLVAIFRNEFK